MFLVLHFHDELLAVLVRAIHIVNQTSVALKYGQQFFVEELDVLHLAFAVQQGIEEVYQQVFIDFLPEDALEAHIGKWVYELCHGLSAFIDFTDAKLMISREIQRDYYGILYFPRQKSFRFLCSSTYSQQKSKFFLCIQILYPYICCVLMNNKGRHIGKERFEDIIPYWNLDNFMHKDNKQENAHVIVIYLPGWQFIYRLAWAFVYYLCRAVESLNKVIHNGSHASFLYMNACFGDEQAKKYNTNEKSSFIIWIDFHGSICIRSNLF